jgi:GDP-L-fucose synthase
MKSNDRIYIAGHTGLVGSALVSKLQNEGYKNLILRAKQELDLRISERVEEFFKKEKPDYVFLAAGKIGNIISNDRYPAEYLYENLMIQTNIIHSAWKTDVKKLLYIGCSCLYPRNSAQPMKEEYLLTGQFEPTNEAYSVAKLAGLKMCQAYNKQYKTNFICCIASNIFGPNDNFDLNTCHLILALIMKLHRAKIKKEQEVIIWGTGSPKRDFLYVYDLADACLFLMNNYNCGEPINVGSGNPLSVKEIAEMIKEIVGFKGKFIFDTTKPDGNA